MALPADRIGDGDSRRNLVLAAQSFLKYIKAAVPPGMPRHRIGRASLTYHDSRSLGVSPDKAAGGDSLRESFLARRKIYRVSPTKLVAEELVDFLRFC